jgi:integrase
MASIFSEYMTRNEFLDRYNSQKTKDMVSLSLKNFDRYCQKAFTNVSEADIYQQLRDAKEEQRYLFLDKMVTFWTGQKIAPSSIKVFFTYVKAWLRTQGIKATNEEVKVYVKFPKKHRETRKPLTVETIKTVLDFCDKKYRAFFLFQLSSGMREGETLALRVKDLDVTSNPVLVHVRAETTKLKVERFTFISTEAYNALKPLLEGKMPDDKLFGMNQKALIMYISKLRRKAKLTDKYKAVDDDKICTRRYHVNIHAFRSFFRTRASDIIGLEAAYFLIGQEGYLSQYYRLTEDDATKKYRQLEPYITISDEQRLKTELEKKTDELNKAEDVDTRLAKLEDYIKMMGEISNNKKDGH